MTPPYFLNENSFLLFKNNILNLFKARVLLICKMKSRLSGGGRCTPT